MSPMRDGTGPQGMGPMTGRQMGNCARPDSALPPRGGGFGRGRRGRGRGRGFGWGFWNRQDQYEEGYQNGYDDARREKKE